MVILRNYLYIIEIADALGEAAIASPGLVRLETRYAVLVNRIRCY